MVPAGAPRPSFAPAAQNAEAPHRIDVGKPTFSRVFGRKLQLVAASIKDDELGCGARPVQKAQHVIEPHVVIPECCSAGLLGINWDQIVDVGVLFRGPVTRLVDEAD